jgi:hypothetical protein
VVEGLVYDSWADRSRPAHSVGSSEDWHHVDWQMWSLNVQILQDLMEYQS